MMMSESQRQIMQAEVEVVDNPVIALYTVGLNSSGKFCIANNIYKYRRYLDTKINFHAQILFTINWMAWQKKLKLEFWI